MHCTSFCHQGREKCPCPQACGIPESPPQPPADTWAWVDDLKPWALAAAALFVLASVLALAACAAYGLTPFN